MALATALTKKKKLLTHKTNSMKKGHRFIIGLASAALCFGVLFGTLGKTEFNKYGKHRYSHCMHHTHSCDDTGNK